MEQIGLFVNIATQKLDLKMGRRCYVVVENGIALSAHIVKKYVLFVKCVIKMAMGRLIVIGASNGLI